MAASVVATETDVIIHGAGYAEANGLYTRVHKNFMTDGGIALYAKENVEKGHTQDWKWRWLIAYYDASTKYGPAFYVQQGEEGAYAAKLKKDFEGFPDMSHAQLPTTGWVIDQGDWKLGAKKPVPLVGFSSDIKAAIAMLQRIADGKDVMTLSRDIPTHIDALASEARRLKVPGAVAGDGLWEGAKACTWYNEMRGEKGKSRPAYASVMNIMQKVMEDDRKHKKHRIDEFPTASNKDFRGDNRLYHIPRMLTKDETEMLVKGITQRAKALRMFVLDMNKSRGVEQMACVKNNALPECVYRRIAARAAHKPTLDLVDKEQAKNLYWSVWYGPDIIRGPDGNGGTKFFVVEDNFGYVGGFGDLIESRRVLLKTFPELEPAIGEDKTSCFYDEMAKHYLSQVAPGEKVVVLYYQRHGSGDASECSDNEDRRMAQLFKKRGIDPVPLPGNNGPTPGQPRLEVRNKKVYMVTPQKEVHTKAGDNTVRRAASPARERPGPSPSPTRDEPPKKKLRLDGMTEELVGMVVLLTEPTDVGPGHESTKLRSAIDNAKYHIEAHEDEVQEAQLKAKGAEKTVIKVNTKVDVTDKDGCKSSLQMKGDQLTWIVNDKNGKEVDRIKGFLSWNAWTLKLSSPKSQGSEGITRAFDENN